MYHSNIVMEEVVQRKPDITKEQDMLEEFDVDMLEGIRDSLAMFQGI